MRIARSRAAAVALAVTATATGLAATAAPATASTGNPYSAQADGHAYRHGAVLTQHEHELATGWEAQHASSNARGATSAKTLSYGGGVDGIGVTSGHEKVYLVFWGTQWGTQSTNAAGNYTFSNDTVGGSSRIESMFKGLGTGGESWSGTMTQYCDGSLVAKGATSCSSSAAHVAYPTGGAFAGVWYDNSAAEPTAATGAQLGAEAVKAAGHFGNTTAASNRYAQYIVLSPKGLNPDSYKTGGFCAWHDWNGDVGASSSYGDIAFTNMPYVMDQGQSCGQNFVNSGSAGTLDGYTIVSGHEYAETITDQNPAGGWTNTGSGTYGGEENADECAWIAPGSAGGAANVSTSTGSFPMQSTWSNDTSSCAISHATVS